MECITPLPLPLPLPDVLSSLLAAIPATLLPALCSALLPLPVPPSPSLPPLLILRIKEHLPLANPLSKLSCRPAAAAASADDVRGSVKLPLPCRMYWL
jgi:hypothetical protein